MMIARHMMITQAQRDELLARAVEAVRALWAVGPDADPEQARRVGEVAQLAVTDAATRGGHLHTQIAQLAGVPGLTVVDLIHDWSAQAAALRVERHAAARYQDQVRAAIRSHAVRRAGAQGRGSVTQMADELGAGRAAVYAWIDQARAEDAAHLEMLKGS